MLSSAVPSLQLSGLGGVTCSSASRPPEAASPTAEDKRLRGGGGVQVTLPPLEPQPGRGPGGTAPCRVHRFV